MREVAAIAVAVAVAYVTGSPQLGIAAGSMVYGATAPNAKVEGPRLSDLKAPQASYGTPIPHIEVIGRTAGTYIWYSAKREIATTSSEGGKGGPGVDSTTFTYEMDTLILISKNQLAGFRRVWSTGKLVFNASTDADSETSAASAATNAWREIRFYGGADDQMPDPDYETAVGIGNAPAYRGRACIFIKGLNLGQSGQLPILTFEVFANGSMDSATDPLFVDFLNSSGVDHAADPATYNGGGSIDPDYDTIAVVNGQVAEWNGAKLRPESGESYTFEAFVVGIQAPEGVEIASPFLQWNFYATSTAGFIYYPPTALITPFVFHAGAADEYGVPFYLGVGHYAIVIEPTGIRLYAGGVLRMSWFGDMYSSSAAPNRVRIGPIATAATGVVTFTVSEMKITKRVLYTGGSYAPPPSLSLDSFASATVSNADSGLDMVVSRLCLRTGLLTADDIDVTALAGDTVRGFAISQVGPTRNTLETLMAAYFFEAVEGEKIKFVKRGGAAALTIPYADLGASANDSPIEALPIRRINDIERAARATVKYSNVLNDYQDGSEQGDRLISESTAVTVTELPIGLEPQEAKRVADVNTMDSAVSLIGIGPVSLTRKYPQLEPSDVVVLTGKDGSTYRARIQKVTMADGVITHDLVLDDATVINSLALTSTGYVSTSLVRNVTLTATEQLLLDVPILREADNDAGFYAQVKPSALPWNGAAVYSSPDDVTMTREATITDSAVFGTCMTTLGDWTGPRVFDETSTVTVDVGSGTLFSSTRDAMLADQSVNAYAIGVHGRWEIGQFRDAPLISPGVHKLTGFLRGARGTEWAMTGHTAGEKFSLLQAAGGRRIALESSLLGVSRFYRAVSVGSSLASAASQQFVDNGVGLKPFSPVDVRAARDATTGDITLTWQRRTRLSVRTVGPMGISVPLGEASESYSVDVFADGAYAVVKRTLTSSTPSVLYTTSQQVADFGSNQSIVYVKVHQISAVVGRSQPAQAAA